MNGKKINKLIFIAVVFAMGFFLPNEKVMGQNWVLVGRWSNNSEIYIDSNSITKISPTNKRIWTKVIIPSEEMVRLRIEQNLPTTRYSSFSHSLVYYEMNCVEKSHIILKIIDYDNGGNAWENFNIKDTSNQFMVPGSILEKVYKAVCP